LASLVTPLACGEQRVLHALRRAWFSPNHNPTTGSTIDELIPRGPTRGREEKLLEATSERFERFHFVATDGSRDDVELGYRAKSALDHQFTLGRVLTFFPLIIFNLLPRCLVNERIKQGGVGELRIASLRISQRIKQTGIHGAQSEEKLRLNIGLLALRFLKLSIFLAHVLENFPNGPEPFCVIPDANEARSIKQREKGDPVLVFLVLEILLIRGVMVTDHESGLVA